MTKFTRAIWIYRLRVGCVVVSSFGAFSIVAGEKMDSPVSQGQLHGFGAMNFDSRESSSAQTIESEFLQKVESAQDLKCRQTSSIELRRLAYLEFRKFMVSKTVYQDQEVALEDLRRFSHFLAEAQSRNQEQMFQAKSANFKTLLNPFPRFSAADNNIQQYFSRLKSVSAKKMLSESGARFGVLDLPMGTAKAETIALLKALQIQAQAEPGTVVKECRLNLFSAESAVFLAAEFQAVSKCSFEHDGQCYARWMSLCPTLQISLFGDLLTSPDSKEKAKVNLSESNRSEWPCASAFNEAAKEIVKKDLFQISSIAQK